MSLTTVLWGGNSVAAKFVVAELPPVITAFLRFACVSTILLTVVWFREGKKCLPRVNQIPGIIAMGITGIFLFNYLIYAGVKESSATNMSLFGALNPVATAFLAAIFLHERLTRAQMAGIAIAFLGVAIVITKGDLTVLAGIQFNHGDILLVLAPISWAVYSIFGRKVMRDFSALGATAWAGLVGTLLLFILALGAGFNGTVSLSFWGWVGMIYMILGSGCMAFFLWNHGISIVGPNRAAIFMNLLPVSGMILAALLIHEVITPLQIGGAALIISGVWLTTYYR